MEIKRTNDILAARAERVLTWLARSDGHNTITYSALAALISENERLVPARGMGDILTHVMERNTFPWSHDLPAFVVSAETGEPSVALDGLSVADDPKATRKVAKKKIHKYFRLLNGVDVEEETV